MKKIVAINTSPRSVWNTAELVRSAADGAVSAGAEALYYDLYKQKPFTGCISCFACKLPEYKGKCVYRDGLTDVLEQIRHADGLVIGSPNYLGDVTAGFRALYERLIFQHTTYKMEPGSFDSNIPVLIIMTSNAEEKYYSTYGYEQMLTGYKETFSHIIGPAKVLIYGDTLQVKDYSKFDWTMFDPEAKKARHETVMPQKKSEAFRLGAEMIKAPQNWGR